MKTVFLLFTILSLSNICFCWWDTGHMLVAKVAELTLKSRSSYDFKDRCFRIRISRKSNISS